jgi:hypothetical protein
MLEEMGIGKENVHGNIAIGEQWYCALVTALVVW